MIACDVNVLVYATDDDAPRHEEYRTWLEEAANDAEPFGLSAIVASGFLRVVTHPRILPNPVPVEAAIERIDQLRAAPAVVPLEPGFTDLCRSVGARGNVVPGAYLAALAIEHGATWYTADRGFARYPGLRSRHPLDAG